MLGFLIPKPFTNTFSCRLIPKDKIIWEKFTSRLLLFNCIPSKPMLGFEHSSAQNINETNTKR